MGMDKFAVEEREEDLEDGDKLVKRADGTAFVKTAGGSKVELDSFDEESGMVKSAGLPSEIAGELNAHGYKVEK